MTTPTPSKPQKPETPRQAPVTPPATTPREGLVAANNTPVVGPPKPK